MKDRLLTKITTTEIDEKPVSQYTIKTRQFLDDLENVVDERIEFTEFIDYEYGSITQDTRPPQKRLSP